LILIFFTGISFLLNGLKVIKKITITPEVPAPFSNYAVIFENLLKGKLDVYKVPDSGPMKFAYNYISDKVAFLTPPERQVVSKNISFLKKYIILFIFLCLFPFLFEVFSPDFSNQLGLTPGTISIPVVFLLLLLSIMAVGLYTIRMMIPKNLPKQDVSENFATINGGGDPNSICPAIELACNEYRFEKVPNYINKSGFVKLDEISFKESASYSGSFSIETHPRYIHKKKNDQLPKVYIFIALISLIISIAYFLMIENREIDFSGILSSIGDFSAGVIFLGTAGTFFSRSYLLFSIYQFESVFIYLEATGNIGKSEITAGRSITDSIETRNIVIRSDSQFKIYTTRLLSECYHIQGERFITAMIVDQQVDEIAQKIIETIRGFKEEGVQIRGVDVSTESLNKITMVNLMIEEAKKSTNALSSSTVSNLNLTDPNSGPQGSATLLPGNDNKECPRCAEIIKAKAKVCRFCNFEFPT
jgi:hypothetical protein